MDVQNTNIDGISFQIHTMGALKAAVLDRKMLAIIFPAISGLANSEDGLDTEITQTNLFSHIGDGLLKLKDDEYKELLEKMFTEVVAVIPGKAPMQLDNESAINEVFKGKIIVIYKLLLEIMKHNGFSVFGLAGDGFLTGITSISGTGKPAKEESGKLSGM